MQYWSPKEKQIYIDPANCSDCRLRQLNNNNVYVVMRLDLSDTVMASGPDTVPMVAVESVVVPRMAARSSTLTGHQPIHVLQATVTTPGQILPIVNVVRQPIPMSPIMVSHLSQPVCDVELKTH